MNSKKQTVTLREKSLKNGNKSLYLDIWFNGRREYKFLKLYIVPISNSLDRENNRMNRKLAEQIRSKTQLELKNREFGFTTYHKLNMDFLDYFEGLVENRKVTNRNHGNWLATLQHLRRFVKARITLGEITSGFGEEFKDYLAFEAKSKSGKSLAINSQHTYFNKVKSAMNKACDDGLIPKNPIKKVNAVKPEEPKRNHLTIEEIRSLVKTECRYPVLKNAFLFSCLTGLRWSDVMSLTWADIQTEREGLKIVFRQKKTRGLEYLDIPEQAKSFMGKMKNPLDRVFDGLKYSSYTNVELSKWMLKAGITKDITYHCSRHTFAVLQLTQGTDIFTVSKLLGHTNLKTTQVYARIIDEKKKQAMNSIPDIRI